MAHELYREVTGISTIKVWEVPTRRQIATVFTPYACPSKVPMSWPVVAFQSLIVLPAPPESTGHHVHSRLAPLSGETLVRIEPICRQGAAAGFQGGHVYPSTAPGTRQVQRLQSLRRSLQGRSPGGRADRCADGLFQRRRQRQSTWRRVADIRLCVSPTPVAGVRCRRWTQRKTQIWELAPQVSFTHNELTSPGQLLQSVKRPIQAIRIGPDPAGE